MVVRIMLKIWHLLMLTVMVVTRGADSYAGEICGPHGEVIHVDVTGLTRCCKEVNCSKGTVAQLCDTHDPASTKCVPCPPNYFIQSTSKSSDMLPCSAMKPCSRIRGLIVKVNGTAVSDNVCECNVKAGYWDPHMKTDCEFEECDRGYELTKEGCQPCRLRMYKTSKSIEMCRPWKNCAALGLQYAPGGNTTHSPGCVNETSGHGTQNHPGVTQTHPVTDDKDSTNERKGGLSIGVIITIAVVSVIVIIFSVALLSCWLRRRSRKDEKPTLPSDEPVEMVAPPGTYQPLNVPRPTSLYPSSQGDQSVGGSRLVVGVDYQSQTYPKQPYDSTPTSPTYHEYDGGHRNGAARSLKWPYEPMTNGGDSQTYLKQPCDSNPSTPTSHTYEGIDYDGVMRNKGGDVEEDAAPATPDENPARGAIRLTTGDNVINITGDVVNVQVGKDNKLIIDS